ncbi:MAG: DUF481 domain-containing protein [Pseudomonadales bacterium]
MKNGDRLTGEIKALDGGQLRLSTTSFGTIYVRWEDIRAIVSDKNVQLEVDTGKRYTGPINTTEDDGILRVGGRGGDVEIATKTIVRAVALKSNESFFERVDGNATFGINFTESSGIGQMNAGLTADYRTAKYLVNTGFNANISRERSGATYNRGDISLGFQRFRPNRWYWTAISKAETNEELGIDLRTSAGGGLGRYVWQSNVGYYSLWLGASLSRENTVSQSESDNLTSAEGQINNTFTYYLFSPRKVNLKVDLDLMPSITESNRVRTQFDVELNWEIFTDFFWQLSYWSSTDSQPPDGAQGSDQGIVTSFGYTF